MFADIFYPIFTLMITVLVCFIWKKTKKQNCLGVSHPFLNQDIPLTPRGAYNSPQTPSCNRFWLCQKPMRPYFFCTIPWQCLSNTTFTCKCEQIKATFLTILLGLTIWEYLSVRHCSDKGLINILQFLFN